MSIPILFPAVVHLRCTEAMKTEISARGGSRWLRAIIEANTRPPTPDVPTAPQRPRKRRAPKLSHGVSLDKRKRRRP